jgi:2-desacetyl-2-hydroxyethyl bacteriochlorophyllide A dehydrogenase
VAETLCSLISTGTELAIYTGSHIGYSLPDPPFPLMPNNPGYALVGRVTAVGQDVRAVQPGQRVMMEVPHASHGEVDIRRGATVVLPESVSDAQGALIRMAEIALTAVRVAPLQLGDAIVVYGLGLVGQLAAQLFQLNGARPVIGIDRIPSRLEVAEANGIVTLNGAEVDVAAEVARLTGGRGPDVVVEATGSPAVVAVSLALVARGGQLVLLGSTRGRVEIDAYSHVHRKGVRIIGAHESAQGLDFAPRRWTQPRNLQLLAELFADRKLKSEGLISHTIAPAEALSIYDALATEPQDYLGVLIDWRRETY